MRTERTKRKPYYVWAVGKALGAMDILRRAAGALSLGEMASRLGLSKGSACWLPHTLEANRCIRRTAEGRYETASEAGAGVSRRLVGRLVELANEPLRELVREFRESVRLAVVFGNHIEVVLAIESPGAVRMGNMLGRIIPPHASAPGKCVSVFQREKQRERLLRAYGIVRFTPNTIVDERRLREEFRRIVSCGYAVDAEEGSVHGYCFAAPIRAPDGVVSGAMSISPPVVRLNGRNQAKMIGRVVETAGTISESLKSARQGLRSGR